MVRKGVIKGFKTRPSDALSKTWNAAIGGTQGTKEVVIGMREAFFLN